MCYYISDLSLVVLFSRKKKIVISNFLASNFLTGSYLDHLNHNNTEVTMVAEKAGWVLILKFGLENKRVLRKQNPYFLK